jgi:predicted nucleotidyltransferase
MVALLDPPRAGRSVTKLQRKRARKIARLLYGSAAEWRRVLPIVPSFIDRSPDARAHRMAKRAERVQARAREYQRHRRSSLIIVYESETLLTDRERKRIDEMIDEYELDGQNVPIHLLDYRWWEIRRKTGWCPWWEDQRYGTVYEWWVGLDPHQRQMFADMSKGAGMRDSFDEPLPHAGNAET